MSTSSRSRWLGEGNTPHRHRLTAHSYNWSAVAQKSTFPECRTRADAHWQGFERHWKVTTDARFAPLVVPTGNSQAAIHRWFHFKEAYSKDLVPALLKELVPDLRDRQLTIADPFVGVGTTLLATAEMVRARDVLSVREYGFEVNPFLHFVSQTKLGASSGLLSAEPDFFRSIVDMARNTADADTSIPELSTFANDLYFPENHVRQLAKLRAAIERTENTHGRRSLALMALAMTVEPASRLRRDGRALRYEAREPLPPYEVFDRAAERILDDLPGRSAPGAIDFSITRQSAMNQWSTPVNGSCDIIVFSPPYPNNIDYTEVYKTELWALGFVTTREQFRAQRHRTMRSHPSVKFNRPLSYASHGGTHRSDIEALLQPLIDDIPRDSRYADALQRMIEGYSDDMLQVLTSSFAALRPGGHCVFVVGNSVHGTRSDPVMIASDVMIARLAELVGFKVQELRVARTLPRRRIDSPYVRESIGILRKPG